MVGLTELAARQHRLKGESLVLPAVESVHQPTSSAIFLVQLHPNIICLPGCRLILVKSERRETFLHHRHYYYYYCVLIISIISFDYYYYDFLLTVGFCSVRQRDPEATSDPSFSYCLVTAWSCVPPLACSSAYELLRVLKLLPDIGSVVPSLISSLFPDARIALRLDARSGNLQLANFESSPRPRKKIASYEGA